MTDLPEHTKKERERMLNRVSILLKNDPIKTRILAAVSVGMDFAEEYSQKENESLRRANEVLREGLKVIQTGVIQSEDSVYLAGFSAKGSAEQILARADKIGEGKG